MKPDGMGADYYDDPEATEDERLTPTIFAQHRFWVAMVYQPIEDPENTTRWFTFFKNVDAATDYVDDMQRWVNTGMKSSDINEQLDPGVYSATVLEAVKGNPNPRMVSFKVLHGMPPSRVKAFQDRIFVTDPKSIGRYVLGWKDWNPTKEAVEAKPAQKVQAPSSRRKTVGEVVNASDTTVRRPKVAKAVENTSTDSGSKVVGVKRPVRKATQEAAPAADMVVKATSLRKKLAAARKAAS